MNINDLNANRSAFQLIRVTLLLMVVLFTTAMIGGTYYFNDMLEKQHSRVFLLETSGNVASATSHEIAPEEMEVLVKDHISDFYRLFFGFDQFNFDSNTESALYLIGNSGKELMRDYKRDNVDRELKANNTVVSVDIEEILVDMNAFPWRAQVKAIQTSRSGNNVYRRRLDSNVFTLTKVSRSPENPHGLMIDSFQIIDVTIVD